MQSKQKKKQLIHANPRHFSDSHRSYPARYSLASPAQSAECYPLESVEIWSSFIFHSIRFIFKSKLAWLWLHVEESWNYPELPRETEQSLNSHQNNQQFCHHMSRIIFSLGFSYFPNEKIFKKNTNLNPPSPQHTPTRPLCLHIPTLRHRAVGHVDRLVVQAGSQANHHGVAAAFVLAFVIVCPDFPCFLRFYFAFLTFVHGFSKISMIFSVCFLGIIRWGWVGGF